MRSAVYSAGMGDVYRERPSKRASQSCITDRTVLEEDSLLTGFKIAGVFGGIMAGIGVMTPSFVIILIIAPIFQKIQNVEYINKAFLGIKGAIAAMILLSAYDMGKSVLKNKFTAVLFILSFILVVFLNFNVIYTLLLSAFIGWVYYLINKKFIRN